MTSSPPTTTPHDPPEPGRPAGLGSAGDLPGGEDPAGAGSDGPLEAAGVGAGGTPAAPPAAHAASVDPTLAALADAYGVGTGYEDASRRHVAVAPATVRAVLGLLGVDASDPPAALAELAAERARRVLPPGAVVRRSDPAPMTARLPAGAQVTAWLDLESGGRVELPTPAPAPSQSENEGEDESENEGEDDGGCGAGAADESVAFVLVLPPGLPLGDHMLRVTGGQASGRARAAESRVTVVPDQVPTVFSDACDPPRPARAWGWMAQLYALRSAGSWGLGDYADLATLAQWSGSPAGGGAGVLLVNPLHAPAPTLPMAPSPYYPASRRFASPLYLRPEALPEFAAASPAVRERVAELGRAAARDPASAQAGDGGAGPAAGRIDRDTVWRAKLDALELLHTEVHGPGPGRGGGAHPEVAGAGGTARGGAPDAALERFATWCALAEVHGPDWRVWPEPLRDPDGPTVEAARADLAHRVAFHAWLQRCCDSQLASAQAVALAAGMPVGIVHDLAVGVDPAGADVWADQATYVTGASIGAPPDTFNQVGQDWGLPPWRPDRLAETNYAPFRQMVRAVLRRGGGVRIDHVLGFFRLWWIPAGEGPAGGTYVRYDADAMLGVLALEATRADALIVGEDLGTVAPAVTEAIARSGVLGSTVLWFERDDDGEFVAPSSWRPSTMASVTTHDLPTAVGFLVGEHVRLRAGLGILGRPVADEYADWWRARAALLRRIAAAGRLPSGVPVSWVNAVPPPGWPDAVLGPGPGMPSGVGGDAPTGRSGGTRVNISDGVNINVSDGVSGGDGAGAGGAAAPVGWLGELALELHRMLVASPARVVLAAPGDAVGDWQQPNLPGTVGEYPNWRLPVADAAGHPVRLEEFIADPAVARLVAVLRQVVPAAPAAPAARHDGPACGAPRPDGHP